MSLKPSLSFRLSSREKPRRRRVERLSPAAKARSLRRPRLEQLEDRSVLSLAAGALTPPPSFDAIEGVAFSNVPVFQFTDESLTDAASAFTATVNTGDATLTSDLNPDNVQIVGGSGSFYCFCRTNTSKSSAMERSACKWSGATDRQAPAQTSMFPIRR
jgi:hypothetical protein